MSEFTEDELVLALRKILSDQPPELHVGLGDDAAVVEVGSRLVILTVDMLVEGVHFDRQTTSARDLGYKSMAVNVSDVAAMGGSPRYALVALAVPPDTPSAWVVELYAGMREAAGEYALSLVGGDTSRSDRVVVSVTVTGEAARGLVMTRGGAHPGDRVAVTGGLGASAGGLRLAQAPRHEVGSAVASEWGRELLAAHLRPQARVGEGQALAGAGATAMMDVSDGLAVDLWRLCRESSVGATIRLADVPVAASLDQLARVVDVDPLQLAMQGGEDYELLATMPSWVFEPAARTLRERFGIPLTDIGEITEEPGLVAVEANGSSRPLEPSGWDHFAP